MKRPLELLNDIRIASPCSADWDTMAGGERVRHCDECKQSVFDISQMTALEAAALLTAGGHVCVRLYRRADGTVLTSDCPVGRAARLRRSLRRAAVAVASWLGLLSTVGCKYNMGGIGEIPAANPAPAPEVVDCKSPTAERAEAANRKLSSLVMGTPLFVPRESTAPSAPPKNDPAESK